MKGEGRGEEKEKVQKGLPSFECPRRFAGNLASVLLALFPAGWGEKQASTFDEHSSFLALWDEKERFV